MRVYTSGQIESGAAAGVFVPYGFTGVVEEMLCDYPSRDVIRCYVAEVYRIAVAVLAAVGDSAGGGNHGDGAPGGRVPAEIGRRPSLDGDGPVLRLINGLFERGSEGGFVRLRSFYRAHDWQRLGDDDLWVLTRKMVEERVAPWRFGAPGVNVHMPVRKGGGARRCEVNLYIWMRNSLTG